MNVLVGKNACGKTSLLEALSLMTSLKSFRTNQLTELIQHQSDFCRVKTQLISPTPSQILFTVSEQSTRISVDEKVYASKSKYPFLGSSVSFTPDDLLLIKGSPDQRRDFLDELSVALDPQFAKVMSRYQRCLKQRNRVLKDFKQGHGLTEQYDLWTEELIDCAVPFMQTRSERVTLLNAKLAALFCDLFNTTEKVTVRYAPRLDIETDYRAALKDKFARLYVAEVASGYTLAGPHRDDLEFQIDGLEAKSFGSQGQIRGIVIALKVAQLELTRAFRSWSPILLLDDIISELDDRRVAALVRFLSTYSGQLFVTTAEVNKLEALHKQFADFHLVSLSENAPNEHQKIPQLSL